MLKRQRRNILEGAACEIQQHSGGMGIRTPGLVIANDALYQLSYTPGFAGVMLAPPQRFSRPRNNDRTIWLCPANELFAESLRAERRISRGNNKDARDPLQQPRYACDVLRPALEPVIHAIYRIFDVLHGIIDMRTEAERGFVT